MDKGVELITKQKKNTKKPGMLHFTDRLLLRKRAVIESVNDFLKNVCQMEHSRHRSGRNFVVNLMSGLAAYSFLPKKPSIHTGTMAFAQDIFIELTLFYYNSFHNTFYTKNHVLYPNSFLAKRNQSILNDFPSPCCFKPISF